MFSVLTKLLLKRPYGLLHRARLCWRFRLRHFLLGGRGSSSRISAASPSPDRRSILGDKGTSGAESCVESDLLPQLSGDGAKGGAVGEAVRLRPDPTESFSLGLVRKTGNDKGINMSESSFSADVEADDV